MAVFGSQDHLVCLAYQHVPAELAADARGEPTCLGFRYTVEWAGIPYRIVDQGYVLTSEGSTTYRQLDTETMRELGLRPVPYEIPLGWRIGVIASYGVAITLVVGLAWRWWAGRRARRAR